MNQCVLSEFDERIGSKVGKVAKLLGETDCR